MRWNHSAREMLSTVADGKSVGLDKIGRNEGNCSKNPCRNFAGIEGSQGVTILGICIKIDKMVKGVRVNKVFIKQIVTSEYLSAGSDQNPERHGL